MLNKKAQISDTLTWIVATIVIIVIIVIFIYFTSALAKAKTIEAKTKAISLSDGSSQEVNWLKEKTSLAYKINKQNKDFIEGWINEKVG